MVLRVETNWQRFLILLFLSACSSGTLSEAGGTETDAGATADGLVDAPGPSDGLGSSDVGAVKDAASGDELDAASDVACDARGEKNCEGDKRCVTLYGWLPEAYCANDLSQMTYATCLPANGFCDEAITWATDPKTGRTLVFSCGPVFLGWPRLSSDQCSSPDAGGAARDR